MNTFTTTADAKDLNKIITLPKEYKDMKFKVTIEPITDEKKIATDLKKIFLEAKKIRISSKVNIDEICNEMNNDLL